MQFTDGPPVRHRTEPAPTRPRRRRLAPIALAAAAALVLAPGMSAAAAPTTASPDAIAAIESGALLPDLELDVAAQFDADAAYEHVRQLAVGIGPRATGTLAEQAAADYVQAQLEAHGYDVTFEQFAVTAPTYGLATSDRELPGGPNWQFRAAPNGLLTGHDAPVVAEVVDLGASTELDPETLTGKLVLADWIGNATARSERVAAIAEAGAAGVILAPTAPNGATQNVGALQTPQEIPVVSGGTAHGERIRALLADGALTLSLVTANDGLPGVTVIGSLPAAVAEPGTAPIVYITAHIDSVVGSPGANDDASGVSVFLEAARIIAQYPLGAEIRIAGWGGEESGLLGARNHLENLDEAERERIVGIWQMDMVGTPHDTDDRPWEFWGHSFVYGDINTVLEHSNATTERLGHGEPNNGAMCCSDHQPFAEAGIPAAVFSWMHWAPPSTFGLEPDYHRPTDTMANISIERLGVAGEIVTASAFRAAANELAISVVDEVGAPVAGARTALRCEGDDKWRDAGITGDDGTIGTVALESSCTVAALADDGASGETTLDVVGDSEVVVTVVADTTAPTLDIAIDPAAAESGWRTVSPVTATAAAADDSGAAPTVEYRLGDGEWLPYEGPIELSEEGVHALELRATDAAGNSTTESLEVRIDTVAPVVSAEADDDDSTILVDAVDAASGVALIEYRLDDGQWLEFAGELEVGDGVSSVSFRATDAAGNVSEVLTIELGDGAVVVPPTDPGETAAPTTTPLPTTSPSTSPSTGAGDRLPATGIDGSATTVLLLALLATAAGAALVSRTALRARGARASRSPPARGGGRPRAPPPRCVSGRARFLLGARPAGCTSGPRAAAPALRDRGPPRRRGPPSVDQCHWRIPESLAPRPQLLRKAPATTAPWPAAPGGRHERGGPN